MVPIPLIFNTNDASIDLLAAMLRNRFTDSGPSQPFMFDIPSAKASFASLRNMTLRITNSNGSVLTLDDDYYLPINLP